MPVTRSARIYSGAFVAGDLNVSGVYRTKGKKVVSARRNAISDVAGGAGGSDGIARAGVNAILAALRSHGLIEA